MHLFKTLTLLSSTILFNYVWASTLLPKDNEQDRPKLNYQELFPSSVDLTRSSYADVAEVLNQNLQTSESYHHYWLLSHFPLVSVVMMEALPDFQGDTIWTNSLLMRLLPPENGNVLKILPKLVVSLGMNGNTSNENIFRGILIKVYKYMLQSLLQLGDTTKDQHVAVLSAWVGKYNDKLTTFNRLATPLNRNFSGDEMRVLLHELAYFLNIIPFESVFEALRGYKQEGDYSAMLANVLGDSLLDGGKRLEEFYKQYDTAIGTIGYLPKDLQAFETSHGSDMAEVLRDTAGELFFNAAFNSGKQIFAKRVWRAACTLHLTAIFQEIFGVGKRWEGEFASQFYQAIEMGSVEVFNSSYRRLDPSGSFIDGHNMLVEVMKIGDKYRVKQFNSGDGINNHKKWQRSTSSSEQRYLSSVDIPKLSEEQIKNTGYYFMSGLDREAMLEKLYANKYSAHDDAYTYPLLYERPQLAGTCVASSKMFYFRSFGFQGRLFEIDFKIKIIKQLLTRINNVMKSGLSRPFLLNLTKAREGCHFNP